MRIPAEAYDVTIVLKDHADPLPQEGECRLVLQYLPELYAEMLTYLSTMEEE